MTDNITKGTHNQIKGKAREEAGKLTGNKPQEIKGKMEQATGKVQEQYIKAKRDIKKAPPRRQKGFTLVELLVVIAILGILAAVMIPNLVGFIGKARVGAANGELGLVRTALNAGMGDAGTLTISNPGTLTSTNDVTVAPGYTVGKYIQGGISVLKGTYTINATGKITAATYPSGGTFDFVTGIFS